MFHQTDFGGFLVCCYKAIQQLNGVEKNSVAISLMLNHNLTGLIGEVCKIVRESSNASCRLDPVATWLVKSCLDVLVPSITEMVNLSLLSSSVPENSQPLLSSVY